MIKINSLSAFEDKISKHFERITKLEMDILSQREDLAKLEKESADLFVKNKKVDSVEEKITQLQADIARNERHLRALEGVNLSAEVHTECENVVEEAREKLNELDQQWIEKKEEIARRRDAYLQACREGKQIRDEVASIREQRKPITQYCSPPGEILVCDEADNYGFLNGPLVVRATTVQEALTGKRVKFKPHTERIPLTI